MEKFLRELVTKLRINHNVGIVIRIMNSFGEFLQVVVLFDLNEASDIFFEQDEWFEEATLRHVQTMLLLIGLDRVHIRQ